MPPIPTPENRPAREAALQQAILSHGLTKYHIGQFCRAVRETMGNSSKSIAKLWQLGSIRIIQIFEETRKLKPYKSGAKALSEDVRRLALLEEHSGRPLVDMLTYAALDKAPDIQIMLLEHWATPAEAIAHRMNTDETFRTQKIAEMASARDWDNITHETIQMLYGHDKSWIKCLYDDRGLKFYPEDVETFERILQHCIQAQTPEDRFFAISRRQNDWVRHRVRAIRERLGMTTGECGEILGWKSPCVTLYENASGEDNKYLSRHHATAIINAIKRSDLTPETLFLPTSEEVNPETGFLIQPVTAGLEALLNMDVYQRAAHRLNTRLDAAERLNALAGTSLTLPMPKENETSQTIRPRYNAAMVIRAILQKHNINRTQATQEWEIPYLDAGIGKMGNPLIQPHHLRILAAQGLFPPLSAEHRDAGWNRA